MKPIYPYLSQNKLDDKLIFLGGSGCVMVRILHTDIESLFKGSIKISYLYKYY